MCRGSVACGVTGWEGDQWSGGCPCSWRCGCQSWSALAFSQSGPGSIIIGDDCPARWHDQDTRGCLCQCLSQSARMLSWGYQEADERMKGKLLLVIKTCCGQNIKAGKTNIEHCLWSSCLLRGNVMSSDSTKQKGSGKTIMLTECLTYFQSNLLSKWRSRRIKYKIYFMWADSVNDRLHNSPNSKLLAPFILYTFHLWCWKCCKAGSKWQLLSLRRSILGPGGDWFKWRQYCPDHRPGLTLKYCGKTDSLLEVAKKGSEDRCSKSFFTRHG